MTIDPFLGSYAGSVIPALVAEMHTEGLFVAGVQGGLARIMRDILHGAGLADIPRGEDLPEVMLAWQATVRARGPELLDLKIVDRDAGLFFAGDVRLPGPWLSAAQTLGWCVLYVRLVPGTDHGDIVAELRELAARGQLVGGRLPLRMVGSRLAAG